MNKINPSYVIYFVALFPLAFLVTFLRQKIGDSWWVVVIAIVYLICVRFLGDYVAKKMEEEKQNQ